MQRVFHTRQFKAGNSLAVRIPAGMAFPPNTKLTIIREGNRLIVEPEASSQLHAPALFAAQGERLDEVLSAPNAETMPAMQEADGIIASRRNVIHASFGKVA